MNLGKYRNVITVQQLYDYALQHNYLGAEASIVLDIINKENFKKFSDNSITTDFLNKIEYTYDDLITLFSS